MSLEGVAAMTPAELDTLARLLTERDHASALELLWERRTDLLALARVSVESQAKLGAVVDYLESTTYGSVTSSYNRGRYDALKEVRNLLNSEDEQRRYVSLSKQIQDLHRELADARAQLLALAAQGPQPSGSRPRIVCLCGSTRFYEAFQQANYDFTMRGEIVLSVGFYPHAKAQTGHGEGVGHDSAEKIALDELHKRKIDLCDYVYVLNVGGYIGSSTRGEIEYAEAHGKPIEYLELPAAPLHAPEKEPRT